MWRSWKLGTAFGIGIYVHWSFPLLVAYAFLHGLFNGGAALAVFTVPLVLAVFACVVLHELGHALMARHFGISTRDITLYPIGGVAKLERMSEDPLEEICIAVAGPAVNVVIAAVLLPVLLLLLSLGSLSGLAILEHGPHGLTALGLIAALVGTLLLSNILLAGFNMIPAFPMDGGRVLRAMLAFAVDRLRATEIAVRVGTVMAVGLAMLGCLSLLGVNLLLNSPLFILLGGFVFVMGRMELAALRYSEARRRAAASVAPAYEDVVDVLPADPQPAFSGFVWDNQARVWVVWRDGRPVATFGAGPE